MAIGQEGIDFSFDPFDPATQARIAEMFGSMVNPTPPAGDPGFEVSNWQKPGTAPGTPGGMDGSSPGNQGGGEEVDPRISFLEEEVRRIRAQQQQTQERQNRDARDAIRRVLAQYQLESLAEPLWNKYTEQYFDFSNEDAIIFSIKEEDAYKRRFAANAARVAKGMPELSPAEYIALEDSYRTTLRSNGMPAGFYDSTEDFKAFIEGDVSSAELNDRLKDGYRVVADADQEVKRQMERLYGISEAQLAAYFIDPDRAKPLLMAADYKRQARTAQIAARAQEQAGITLTGDLAEELARRGVTADEAEKGFQEIGALGELRQQFGGEEAISDEGLVRQAFGADVAAKSALERRKRTRVGEFTGGGGFTATTGDTQGALRLGVGQAQ